MDIWQTIETPQQDEYYRPGDAHSVQCGKWFYVWNEQEKSIRRYGPEGEYQEANARQMPDSPGMNLSNQLQALFQSRKKWGTLVANET